jgi:hypothetical protein
MFAAAAQGMFAAAAEGAPGCPQGAAPAQETDAAPEGSQGWSEILYDSMQAPRTNTASNT